MNEIKYNKGNIPINKDLLNKYANVREIFDNEGNTSNREIQLNTEIIELENINLEEIKLCEIKKIAKNIFNKYNNFEIYNNKHSIIITNGGIYESIEKIYNNNKQRQLIKEHLLIVLNLNIILKNAILINQTIETKNRNDILFWNYYISYIVIKNIKYKVVIDVRSMQDGKNQYRIQRIEKYE